MAYPAYSRQMLADFTGRPVASFPEPYTTSSAIPQSLLLFKMGTCLAAPDDLSTDDKQLVDYGVLSMADAIGLASRYTAVKANPFNSESIGSYSYSKAVHAVQNRLDTGVVWFDLAIDKLSICEGAELDFAQGGIEIFEHDGPVIGGRIGGQKGNVRFLSPQDINASRRFGYDPAPGMQLGAFIPLSGDDGDWIEDPDNPGLYFWED